MSKRPAEKDTAMIRKTLIAAAALAALTSGFAGNAEAKLSANGLTMNGISVNGVSAQSAAPVVEGLVLPSGVILLAR